MVELEGYMQLEEFKFIGMAVRTTNENSQAMKDISALWQRFSQEGVLEKIPGKIDLEILCVYTHYEGDYTLPYDAIIGCRVSSIEKVPEGLVGIDVPAANYEKFTAVGNIQEGCVGKAWHEIWKKDLDRTYIADFEVYGEKSADPSNATVEIFIGIK